MNKLIDKKIAFVFPGQGSQKLAMLADVAAKFPLLKKLFNQASEILAIDLWDIVCHGPVEQLNNTINTQPIMLTADIAMWQIWQQQNGIMPIILAGHSLGEYAALTAAGAIKFSDAIALVRKRAEYMQRAVADMHVAMAAIMGLDAAAVIDICAQATKNDIVEAVNFNSPAQIVISGIAKAVDRAAILAKKRGARKVKVLPVEVPSHCSLMQPAAADFAAYLAKVAINTPKIEVINNVDANIALTPNDIRVALTKQLYSPVQWVKTVELMVDKGITMIVECGPGKVLTGLNKRIAHNVKLIAMNSVEGLQKKLHI